jgi:NDP-sugar pyrophosphorylase family protein
MPPAKELARVHGIILAGVHAWGGDVLEHLVARPLLPVADRPLIVHILNWLTQAGIREASVCANSDTSSLRKSLGDGSRWSARLEYYEDVMPRGPAGCVRDAVAARDATECVVVDGTIIPDVDLVALLAFHRQSDAAMTVVAGAAGTERVGGDPAAGGLQPLGIYVFARSAWEQVPPVGYQDIKEKLIPRLFDLGRAVVLHAVSASAAPRVTGVASYLAVNRWAVRRLAARLTPPERYARVGEAAIHQSAQLDPAVKLVGPVLVGPECVVRRGVIITGPTAIGSGARIGRGAVLSRSVLWSRCIIGEGAVVDQSILTDDACIEPGAVVRNTVYMEARAARLPLRRR